MLLAKVAAGGCLFKVMGAVRGLESVTSEDQANSARWCFIADLGAGLGRAGDSERRAGD